MHAQSILAVISNVAFAIAMEQPTEKKTKMLSLSLTRLLCEHFQAFAAEELGHSVKEALHS